MARTRTVPLPGTHRNNWPGSNRLESFASSDEVALTAWLPPSGARALDLEAALHIASLPLPKRRYEKRADLLHATGAELPEALAAYCKHWGFRVEKRHWRSVDVIGPIERLAEAFEADVAIFADANGRRFRHRAGALHAPPEVARALRSVSGLHQWPHAEKLGTLQRHATPLTAKDVCERYAFPDADGEGQTIGVIQLCGEFRADDFDRCMKRQHVRTQHPLVKRVDRASVAHRIQTTQDLESALDAQIIAALAPRARIVIYEAPNDERGLLDAIRNAIFDEECAPSILSISYGWPESLWTPVSLQLLNELFAAAALLGISVFCSSGDHSEVGAPASSPFVHACGGTVVVNSPSEKAWEHSGGGFSAHYDAPPWQHGERRGVPDVAAQVVPGYLVYLDGTELAMGGTSAVAPVWAALTARINQRLGVNAGLMSPLLYASARRAFRVSGSHARTGLGVPIGTAVEAALVHTT